MLELVELTLTIVDLEELRGALYMRARFLLSSTAPGRAPPGPIGAGLDGAGSSSSRSSAGLSAPGNFSNLGLAFSANIADKGAMGNRRSATRRSMGRSKGGFMLRVIPSIVGLALTIGFLYLIIVELPSALGAVAL